MDQYTFQTIGILHSPFREKFGIPRQPGLVPHALSRLELLPPFNTVECVQGLQDFSHLWLSFIFHATAAQGWQSLVRPPRLGGNTTRGIFATRSMFRPNPLGLSVVELVDIIAGDSGTVLLLRGADLLDGTPILDIKPYIPYADCIPSAHSSFAQNAPITLPVQWSAAAKHNAQELALPADFCALIEEVLAQDPRPAYRTQQADAHEYGMWLENINVRFCVTQHAVFVLALEQKCKRQE